MSSSTPTPAPGKRFAWLRAAADSIWNFFDKVAKLITNVKEVAAALGVIVVAVGVLFGIHLRLPSSLEALLPPSGAQQPSIPAKSVVIVSSDDLMANSYATLISNELPGVGVSYLDFSQIDALPGLQPGLVIIGSAEATINVVRLSAATKSFLTGGAVKVLAVGVQGAFILNQISPGTPLSARNSVGITNSEVVLGHRLPDILLAHLPLGGSFHLYTHDGSASGVAVYDGGSLERQGAKGIAQVWDSSADECSAHYWAVASQGNEAIWGFTINANDLTQEGTQLFVNTVEDMLSTRFATLQSQQQEYFRPDTYYNRSAGCHYPSNTYRIKVSGAQTMHIKVSSKSSSLQVVILGPLETDKVVRPAGQDIPVTVSRQSAAKGGDWTVTVIYTGHMSTDTTVNYDLTLDYLSSGPANVRDAIIVIGLAIASGILVVVGLVWFYRRRLWQSLMMF